MKRFAIILAGGSGTRLWPLSTNEQPKPLLEVFSHTTMLENTVLRAKLFADEVYVLTEADKELQIAEALAGLGLHHNVIVEPTGAGTEAAIAYGVAYMKAKYGEDVFVAFLPVDHRIKNQGAFYRDVNYAIKSAINNNTIVLFGVTPSFPATGYGYIRLGHDIEQKEQVLQYTIKEFLEKPDAAIAKKLLKSEKNVWNSGLYMGAVSAFEALFQVDEVLYSWYQTAIGSKAASVPSALANRQFEQAVIQRATNLRAVIATFDWADIGTYDMLYQSAPQTDERDNALRGDVVVSDCDDCLILGRDRKIVALGLEDIAVIDGPDGILVCKKSTYSQNVGKVATGQEQPKGHYE